MKGILEFNLYEDQEGFEIACHAVEWKALVCDIDKQLRDALKYGHDYKTADEALEKTRNYIRDMLIEEGLSLD